MGGRQNVQNTMYEMLEELTVFLGKQGTLVMSRRLRACDDLSEEPASLPSTQSRWLTITCISSSRGSLPSFDIHGHCMQMIFILINRHMHIHVNNNTFR